MAVFSYPVEIAAVMNGPFERLDTIVDTGSSYLWLPASTLARIGANRLEQRDFITATGEKVIRDMGQVVIRLDGRTRFVDCVFGDEGSTSLLGAITLEQFGLAVDPVNKRLIPVPGYALAAPTMTIREALEAIVNQKQDLSEDEAAAVMTEIMTEKATPAQLGAFLVALRLKGETVEEIAGMARVMRQHALRVPVEGLVLDTAGTGGDASGSFNVSTAAAFVAAACGVKVAKHGNRAMSSHCGSADVLEALGARIDTSPEQISRCIQEVGIGFMMAPNFHPATKFAGSVRREIGVRNVFNILGPLTNPAGANAQLIGVPQAELAAKMAAVLQRLGCHHALVVHGQQGLDELSISGPSLVYEVTASGIRQYEVSPRGVGLQEAPLTAVRGGSPSDNAAAFRAIFSGQAGPLRDIVLLNAAAALVAADRAKDLRQGIPLAANAIDSGAAQEKLDAFIEMTRSFAEPEAQP